MARPRSTISLFVIFTIIPLCMGNQEFFEEIPKELRCSGCELTVKILDRMMTKHSAVSLERHVKDAMEAVCDVKRFSISEYKPERMEKVCNFMLEKHGSELNEELIKHYRHPKRSTYLEFAQHICIDVMKLCAGVSHKHKGMDHEDDTLLHFDSDTHGFTVVPGRNIRLPRPVREAHHDEL